MEELPLKPRRGRKEKFPGQSRAEKKRRINQNEDFIDNDGNLKKAKEFRAINSCCVEQCCLRMDFDKQQEVFTHFHGLGSFERRVLFFANNIHNEVKNRVVKRIYNINDVKVCARFFNRLLQIDHNRAILALKKFKNLNIKDMRGVYKHPRLSSEKEEFIIDVDPETRVSLLSRSNVSSIPELRMGLGKTASVVLIALE